MSIFVRKDVKLAVNKRQQKMFTNCMCQECVHFYDLYSQLYSHLFFFQTFLCHMPIKAILTIYSLITYKYPFQLIFTLFLVLNEIRYKDSVFELFIIYKYLQIYNHALLVLIANTCDSYHGFEYEINANRICLQSRWA